MLKLQGEFRKKILPTMSQDHFCQLYGINAGNFAHWLRNAKTSPASACAVARALQTQPDEKLDFIIKLTRDDPQTEEEDDEVSEMDANAVLDCSFCYQAIHNEFLSCPATKLLQRNSPSLLAALAPPNNVESDYTYVSKLPESMGSCRRCKPQRCGRSLPGPRNSQEVFHPANLGAGVLCVSKALPLRHRRMERRRAPRNFSTA
eukprot:c9743_g1_i2.p1 GENE.c9743_g1_i2~~c9743_g1_i2.p1  ORF type:complete len:227 (-),score=26.68 c9743_g1_i2:375-986(-)